MDVAPTQGVVGICGIGQMGSSAAISFSRAGFPVLLWGRDPSKHDAARQTLARHAEFLDQNAGAAESPGTITIVSNLGDLDESADVILECVAEDLATKSHLLSQLTQAPKRQSLLLSTTSGLSITEMGRRSGTQHLLVGTHFWNPAHLMPIVEVIRGADTPDDRMEAAINLVRKIGKIPVRVEKDVPGFIGNRLLHALWREAIHLVETGVASPEDIDQVASLTFGLRLPAVGPFANMDLVGLELLANIQSYLLADLSTAVGVQAAVRQRIENGELGMKSERGFHDWSKRDPQAVRDRRDRQIIHQLRFLKLLN